VKILALDLGTVTGWATDVSGKLEYGEMDFSLQRGESPGMRYHNFNSWLRRICCPTPFNEVNTSLVDLVVYEMPHVRGGAANDVLTGMSTRVHEFCATHESRRAARPVDYEMVHSATLKKYATGKGNADKDAMVVAAKRMLFGENGVAPIPSDQPCDVTDNMADALWLFWRTKAIRG
jgi:crossover junction endodeoxyribonuclease RuvC